MKLARLWVAAVCVLLALPARADPPRRHRHPPEAHPAEDEALVTARAIAAHVRGLPNLRARHPLGAWTERESARWSIRASGVCMDDLRAQGIAFTPLPAARGRGVPIPTPVRIDGPIGGVLYRKRREGAPLVVACELAARLGPLSRILAAHGVTEAEVLSPFRLVPETRFRTMGLALDLHTFRRGASDWVVELRALVCELGASGSFSTVLTPEYDADHFDHLHVDLRPDDVRVFVL